MIIEKIVIKSFGRITDMTMEFSDKINVIEGENESGKSTIAAFIRYMLYGFTDDGSAELSERRKRINWDTGMAAGSMYVRIKEKRYMISRSTVPTDSSEHSTYKEEASIIDVETGAPAFGKLPAGEVFFGVDSELFDNTAFIGQVGDAGINEGSVKQSIENIIFSGSEKINKQRAAARISDKMQALLHEGGGAGAIIDLLNKEKALSEKLVTCNMDNRTILEKESELHAIKSRRAETEEKQAQLYELDNSYNNAMLIQTFDQLHILEQESEEKNEYYSKFIEDNTRADFCPDDNYYSELVLARKGLNEAYYAVGETQETYNAQKAAIGITREIENSIRRADELGGEDEIVDQATSFWKQSVRDMALSIVCALLVLTSGVFEIVAAGKADMLIGQILMGILGVCALGGGIFFIVHMLLSNKKLAGLQAEFDTSTFEDLKGKMQVVAEARGKRDSMEVATENARLALVKAQDRHVNAQRELATLIQRWGEEPPMTEIDSFLDSLENKVKSFLDEKNRLLEEKTTLEITVKDIRRNLADKSEIAVRAQVSPLLRRALSNVKHDEIINNIAATKAKIADEDKLVFDIENELAMLKVKAGDPGEYYSRIDAIATRREDMQRKHKAYFIALNAINSASDNLRAEISPRLGEYATKLMEIMTDRKYTSFDVNDGLKLSFIDESGEKKSVDFLSGGTKDMAYIAVRAALIDMLYGEKPPVCFDESFAHQDNVRARAMMKAIGYLADEGTQSFIFTCRGREAALAAEISPESGIYRLAGRSEV